MVAAQGFAGDYRVWSTGSVILETVAPPAAIISAMEYPPPVTEAERAEWDLPTTTKIIEWHDECEYLVGSSPAGAGQGVAALSVDQITPAATPAFLPNPHRARRRKTVWYATHPPQISYGSRTSPCPGRRSECHSIAGSFPKANLSLAAASRSCRKSRSRRGAQDGSAAGSKA